MLRPAVSLALILFVAATCSSCAHRDLRGTPANQFEIKACRPRTIAELKSSKMAAVDASTWKGEAKLSADNSDTTSKPKTSAKAKAPQVPAPAPDEPLPKMMAAEGGGFTLDVLIQMALANNPTLRQAGFQVSQAEGNWLQSGLYPNPVAGYMSEDVGDDGTSGQQGAFVSQTIVTAGKLDRNRNVAAWDVERNRWQAEAQQRAVINSVRVQFYRLLAAQQTVSVAEELLAILQRGVKTAKEILKVGEVPETDVFQAELERATVEILLRNAKQNELGVRRNLAAVLGMQELPAGSATGKLDEPAINIDFDSEWQKIQSISPVLQMARTQIQRARAQAERERVQPIPDIQMQGSLTYDHAGEQTLFGSQIGIMLPIHNRNQGNIAAAQAAVHQGVENLSRLEFAIRRQLATAVNQYEVAQTQVQLYQDTILPKARQTLDLTTKGYEAGQIDFLRVLTARRTYVENQVDFIAALADLRSAQVRIDGLLISGGLNNPTQILSQSGSQSQSGGGAVRKLSATPKTR